MKVNKTQVLLFMLLLLKEKGYLSRMEILEQVDIKEQTFRRYIQELRAFLYNFHINQEVIYSRNDDCYYLKK